MTKELVRLQQFRINIGDSMSEKPKVRVRRKAATETDSNDSTSRFKRKSTPEKKPAAPSVPTPASAKFDPLDLSAFEDDAFDLSMDDVFMEAVTRRYRVGDQVKGTICGVQSDAVLIDINAKSEATLPVDDPTSFTIGDQIEAKIVRMDSRGILLAQKIGKSADMSAYEVAYTECVPVEGSVLSSNKGGFAISFGSTKGFCPISQMTLGAVKAEDHVGQTYEFLITEIKSDELIVSRRRLIEQERESKKEARLAQLSPGMNLLGKILNITPHGAFVDLDGVDGLIPKFIFTDISEDLSVGDEIEVQIKTIKDGKISLAAPSSNPWLKMGTEFQRGGTYTARITKVKEFGFFAKLAPNLEGLLHRSKLSPEEIQELKVDKEVSVRVQDFDIEKKRIELQLGSGETTFENAPAKTLGDAFSDVFAQFGFDNADPVKKTNLRNKRKK